MTKTFKSFVLMLVIAALVYSCKSETGSTDEIDIDIDTTVVDDNANIVENSMMFKLPSPVELYIFLWEENAEFDASLLNSTDLAGNYITTDKKAINFGVYSSDLAYCTVFGKNQETFDYFTTVKQIADELGLMEGFDESMANRIDQNISNSDSLYKLSTESYSDAITYLESIEQENLLPYILAGAWLESTFIAANTVKKFSEEDPLVLRVVEQQMNLENLVEYLESIPEDEQMKALLDDLYDLLGSYDKLYDNTDVMITVDQFNEILGKINNLRNNYTS